MGQPRDIEDVLGRRFAGLSVDPEVVENHPPFQPSQVLLDAMARAKERAARYKPPVDPEALRPPPPEREVHKVQIVAVENLAAGPLAYARILDGPPGFPEECITFALPERAHIGVKGTASFRVSKQRWEFLPEGGRR